MELPSSGALPTAELKSFVFGWDSILRDAKPGVPLGVMPPKLQELTTPRIKLYLSSFIGWEENVLTVKVVRGIISAAPELVRIAL